MNISFNKSPSNAEDHFLNDINSFLNDHKKDIVFYSTITFMPIGIILDLFTSIIFKRKRFKNITMGFYYSNLSLINSLALINGVTFYLPYSLDNNLGHISSFTCMFFKYTRLIFIQMSVWLQLLITFERTVSIRYPSRFLILKKKKCLVGELIFLFAILTLLIVPVWYYELEEQKHGKVKCENPKYSLYLHIEGAIVGFSVPFVIMLILNFVLVGTIILSKKRIVRNSPLTREIKVAATIIGINFVFLCMNLPSALTLILENINKFLFVFSNEVGDLLDNIDNVLLMLSYLYLSMDFIFNILFNKIFKREVIQILKRSDVNTSFSQAAVSFYAKYKNTETQF
jgi:hypothetical protein